MYGGCWSLFFFLVFFFVFVFWISLSLWLGFAQRCSFISVFLVFLFLLGSRWCGARWGGGGDASALSSGQGCVWRYWWNGRFGFGPAMCL